MICQKCHQKTATARYIEVVEGKAVEQHVCAECLAKYLQGGSEAFSLNEIKPRIHAPGSQTEQQKPPLRRPRQACPACNTSLATIMEKKMVGCTECYRHFYDTIEEILGQIQPGTRHQGRSSARDDARSRLRNDLRSKRALLRSVLKVEDYEQAAILRDEIRRLEAGLQIGGGEELP